MSLIQGQKTLILISNSPLYRMYTTRLAMALNKGFGNKSSIDMFTFGYIAGSGGNTVQNSAVFETEISIMQGLNTFRVVVIKSMQ